MKKTRRQWLKNTLQAGAAIAAAPRSLMLADPAPQPVRNLALNRAAYASSSANFIDTGHMATDGQTATQWSSKDSDPQWVYVDLGDLCDVSKVVLRWSQGYAKAYRIQASTVAEPSPLTGFVETWTDIHGTSAGKGGVEEVALTPTKARYVRLLCSERAAPGGYSLSGFEVYGTGGPKSKPVPVPAPRPDGTLELSSGWKLVNQAFVPAEPARISTAGYDDSQWLAATVPGTVLTTYLNVGAVPDMYYGDHQFQVSDSFAHSQFWYRTEVTVPAGYKGKRVWLNLDGINYKADIYLNGSLLGKMAGAFILGRFDITDKVVLGKKNCLAVLIYPVTNPYRVAVREMSGRDAFMEEFTRNAPTFVESGGWDWIPTIRDRNIGIWNKVTLSTSGDVTIVDPFLITDLPLLPDVSQADLTLKVEVRNHSQERRSGILRVELGPVRFAHPVSLEGGETKALSLDKSAHAELSMRQPRLWWPNGYGDQYLYDLSVRFDVDGAGTSDTKTSKVGIRKFTYNQDFAANRDAVQPARGAGGGRGPAQTAANPLTLSCNGQRILLKGACWGMDEGMLRCDAEGYEDRVRLEKDMNYTIIRNALGNVAKQEFFDSCDRHGVLVWEEFGLNHSSMPYDHDLFMSNVPDRIRSKRNHACLALWCTANEGFTLEPIRTEIPKLVEALDGTRLFLQSSTQRPSTDGDGPYTSNPPTFYFGNLAHGFRPEVGSSVVLPIESMRRMGPHNDLWPIGPLWGTHDWWRSGYSGSTEKAFAAYGAPTGIEDCCRKAQMVNMEVFKAIYESWNDKLWDNCTGVMIWMSNPVWPSLDFNTYDYYLEPTGAYFGIKKACEPVHIQWSMSSNNVKAVNCTLKPLNGLSVEARVYNLDGSLQLKKSVALDCPANSAEQCFNLFEGSDPSAPNLSSVHFIALELKDAAGRSLSTNFYWRAKETWKYDDLSSMSRVAVNGTVKSAQEGDACKLTVNLANANKTVALMTRLKVVDPASGLLVAPIWYSENYFSLTPGESRAIAIDFRAKKVLGSEVRVMVEGWNVAPKELARVQVKRSR
jgi:hypothetical protein